MGTFPHSNHDETHVGNKWGTKLKDPEVRQEAYKQYCEHLASGMPKQAFHFDHPTLSVTYKTLDRYLSENPEEFPPLLMERAKALRYKHWINEGIRLMKGEFKGGSPVVWQTMMRNLFKELGWDRMELKSDEQETSKAVDALMKQLKTMQEISGKVV